jgi:cation transport ATPase
VRPSIPEAHPLVGLLLHHCCLLGDNRERLLGESMGIATNRSFPQNKLTAVGESSQQLDPLQIGRVDVVIFALVGISAAVSWSGVVPRIHGVDPVAVAAVLGGGYTVFREALENLISRRITMELSMTIALGAALAIREFSTAVFILFFVLGVEILEELTLYRGRKAIQNLLSLLP